MAEARASGNGPRDSEVSARVRIDTRCTNTARREAAPQQDGERLGAVRLRRERDDGGCVGVLALHSEASPDLVGREAGSTRTRYGRPEYVPRLSSADTGRHDRGRGVRCLRRMDRDGCAE